MTLSIITLLGLLFGSFAGAQTWRLRARQLQKDQQSGELLSKSELIELKQLEPLLKNSFVKDRSRCLRCSHELSIIDLFPLFSWLSTAGRCRYCKKRIGWFEPAIEVGVAAAFALSYIFWPWPFIVDSLSIALFVLWLISVVAFSILFAYDTKWFLLPDVLVRPLMVAGAVFAAVKVSNAEDLYQSLGSLLGAILLLSGLYALLFYYSLWRSKGESSWIGFGDVKLGLVLALFLADWRLAFATLFLANLIGSFIAIPGLLLKILPRGAHIPFGPLFITAFFIVFLWGNDIVDWFNMLVLY